MPGELSHMWLCSVNFSCPAGPWQPCVCVSVRVRVCVCELTVYASVSLHVFVSYSTVAAGQWPCAHHRQHFIARILEVINCRWNSTTCKTTTATVACAPSVFVVSALLLNSAVISLNLTSRLLTMGFSFSHHDKKINKSLDLLWGRESVKQ